MFYIGLYSENEKKNLLVLSILTLCLPMEFPIKFDAVKFHGHSIVYIEVSQVIISGSSILSKQIVQTLMLVSV